MRIAYICADAGVPVFGTKGCSVHIQEIVKQFLRIESEVTLYAVRTGGDCCFESSRFRCVEYPIDPNLSITSREIMQECNAKRMAARVDVENTDLVYERYSLWSCEALMRAKQLRIPSVLEVNAPLIEEQSQHRALIRKKEAEMIRDLAFLAATTIVAVSERVAQYVRDHLPDSEHCKVHVVPNGVDTDRFRPGVQPHSANRHFTIGFLGTLKPWHGLESLISAFAMVQQRIPEVILRIIGDGPLRDSLNRQLLKSNPSLLSSIQWMGAVQPSEVPGQLTALDVAVAPYLDSPDFYFSPLKIFEYMAAGRAIVASSIGQLQSVIQDGHTGLLYTPGNAQQLADRICQLAKQPELISKLGRAARIEAEKSHSWRHVLETILKYVMNPRFGMASRSGHGAMTWMPAQFFEDKH